MWSNVKDMVMSQNEVHFWVQKNKGKKGNPILRHPHVAYGIIIIIESSQVKNQVYK